MPALQSCMALGADLLRCPNCERVMRVHAVVRGAWVTRPTTGTRLLHIGMRSNMERGHIALEIVVSKSHSVRR